jgi:cytochrome c556
MMDPRAGWPGTRMPVAILSLLGVSSVVLGCSRDTKTTERRASPFRPTASILELMDAEVDPAADFLWGSVASISTRAGMDDREPHTAEEWAEVRRKAILLSEATNLLLVPGRRVSAVYVPSHGPGELDSTEVQRRIDANQAAFEALAHVLQEASQQALAAIDAKNPANLMEAGGTIDAACEGCHVVFWYPDQSA